MFPLTTSMSSLVLVSLAFQNLFGSLTKSPPSSLLIKLHQSLYTLLVQAEPIVLPKKLIISLHFLLLYKCRVITVIMICFTFNIERNQRYFFKLLSWLGTFLLNHSVGSSPPYFKFSNFANLMKTCVSLRLISLEFLSVVAKSTITINCATVWSFFVWKHSFHELV